MSMVKLENYGIVDTASTTPLRFIQLTHKGKIIELWVFEESGRIHAWAERNEKYERLNRATIVNSEDPEATKKYYIKLKGGEPRGETLNYNTVEDTYFIADDVAVRKIKTQFTKQDIKDFGLQKFADSELFELEEVE